MTNIAMLVTQVWVLLILIWKWVKLHRYGLLQKEKLHCTNLIWVALYCCKNVISRLNITTQQIAPQCRYWYWKWLDPIWHGKLHCICWDEVNGVVLVPVWPRQWQYMYYNLHQKLSGHWAWGSKKVWIYAITLNCTIIRYFFPVCNMYIF